MRNIFISIITIVMFTGCTNSQFKSRKTLIYPYVATPKRQAQILNGMGKVHAGMSPSDVEVFLGKPDDICKLYAPQILNSKIIGYTWWFIIERKSASGSIIEKAEKLVRVSFDLKNKVTMVNSWGIKKK